MPCFYSEHKIMQPTILTKVQIQLARDIRDLSRSFGDLSHWSQRTIFEDVDLEIEMVGEGD